jgi:hypothetical protein
VTNIWNGQALSDRIGDAERIVFLSHGGFIAFFQGKLAAGARRRRSGFGT